MKYLILIISIFFAQQLSSIDESKANELFELANTSYNQQDWSKAIESYKQIDSDYYSPELYSNMANAYFKNGDLAESIYYYNKALKLDPSDKDIIHNLEYVNNLTMDKIESLNSLGLSGWWHKTLGNIGADTLAYLSILIVIISVLAFILFLRGSTIRHKRLGFSLGIITAVLSLLLFWSSITTKNYLEDKSYGIVMLDKLDVKNSPNDSSENVFVLHEGAKVKILNEENSWYNISLGDDRIGWVKYGDVKGI